MSENGYSFYTGEVVDQKDTKRKVIVEKIIGIVQVAVVSVLLAVFTWLFIATPHEVVGYSMEPNFHNESFVVATKISYYFHTPERGDVIIFKRTETRDYIKRVIGLPGDEIMIKDCKVYINGKQLDESEYLSGSVCTEGDYFLHEDELLVIPNNTYFVMGDNRPKSTDSRAFGPISSSVIKGSAFFVVSSGAGEGVFLVKKPRYN